MGIFIALGILLPNLLPNSERTGPKMYIATRNVEYSKEVSIRMACFVANVHTQRDSSLFPQRIGWKDVVI